MPIRNYTIILDIQEIDRDENVDDGDCIERFWDYVFEYAEKAWNREMTGKIHISPHFRE